MSYKNSHKKNKKNKIKFHPYRIIKLKILISKYNIFIIKWKTSCLFIRWSVYNYLLITIITLVTVLFFGKGDFIDEGGKQGKPDTPSKNTNQDHQDNSSHNSQRQRPKPGPSQQQPQEEVSCNCTYIKGTIKFWSLIKKLRIIVTVIYQFRIELLV